MLSRLEKKVVDFIKANGLFDSAEKLLLAASGGADSTALLYVMHALKAGKVLTAELVCAHTNHQLRGAESDLDREFVVAQAAELKLPVTTRRLDVRGSARRNKLSIETAARQLRIEALIDIAKESKCDAIVTAHQKNDNAETLIQRLSRGTGLRGLAGIWPARVFAGEIEFVRPLLCVTRGEIIEYLRERNIEWRQDHTNADCAYRRNYIRHRLLPALQRDCTNSVVEQLSVLARSARGFYGVICRRVDEVWPSLAECAGEKIALDLEIFLNQAKPVKVELIRRSLAGLGCGERDLTRQHYQRVLQLASQNVSGRKMELPGGFAVWRDYGCLVFSGNRLVGQAPPYIGLNKHVTLNVPGKTKFGNYLIEATIVEAGRNGLDQFKTGKTDDIEWFDLERIKPPLVVRFRRAGDRFIPLGMAQEKKLGKFLTAQRVPHPMRRKVLVIADGEKIIWVCPVRISEQAKITGETRRILQLHVTEGEFD
ncbi:MAG: tRNA lysidine(34) synthetase TilS [Planctomycetes bacterium B3_Pla]|nr:MAG: tRNA lysidine(34) synthetase TilS [Planctomycetes bacterium B3_Pla]